LDQAMKIKKGFDYYHDEIEIVAADVNSTFGKHNSGPSYFDDDDDDYSSEYEVTLRTYQTPFYLDSYDLDGKVSSRFVISDISFYVEDDNLIIDIEGRKTYEASDLRWSQVSIEWTLIAPDRSEYYGFEHLVDPSVGEHFEIHIEEMIFESGTYILKMKIDN
jgi:hypothetical protein